MTEDVSKAGGGPPGRRGGGLDLGAVHEAPNECGGEYTRCRYARRYRVRPLGGRHGRCANAPVVGRVTTYGAGLADGHAAEAAAAADAASALRCGMSAFPVVYVPLEDREMPPVALHDLVLICWVLLAQRGDAAEWLAHASFSRRSIWMLTHSLSKNASNCRSAR